MAAIVGGSAGLALLLAAVIAGVLWHRRREKMRPNSIVKVTIDRSKSSTHGVVPPTPPPIAIVSVNSEVGAQVGAQPDDVAKAHGDATTFL